MQSFFILFLLPSLIASEGYICPLDPKYTSLGQTEQNYLLYSYYDASGNTWITKNEYGFTSPESYCSDKGNANLHPNENLEIKCNDSRFICMWQNNSCVYTGNYQCSSVALCDAVLNNQESACLGSECAIGGNNDFLYNLYCNIQTTPTDTLPTDPIPTDTIPTDTIPTDTTNQIRYIMYPNSNTCKEKIIYV